MLKVLLRIEAKVDRALALLLAIARAVIATESEIETLMSTTAELQAAIDADLAATTAQTSIVEGVATMLGGIDKRVADAIAAFQAQNPGVDVGPLLAAKDQILANNAKMTAALLANTPHAAPTPAVEPTPPAAPPTPPAG